MEYCKYLEEETLEEEKQLLYDCYYLMKWDEAIGYSMAFGYGAIDTLNLRYGDENRYNSWIPKLWMHPGDKKLRLSVDVKNMSKKCLKRYLSNCEKAKFEKIEINCHRLNFKTPVKCMIPSLIKILPNVLLKCKFSHLSIQGSQLFQIFCNINKMTYLGFAFCTLQTIKAIPCVKKISEIDVLCLRECTNNSEFLSLDHPELYSLFSLMNKLELQKSLMVVKVHYNSPKTCYSKIIDLKKTLEYNKTLFRLWNTSNGDYTKLS
ncbi:unnamed protein product [Moneuplotes crassus]|uniref:Uncharacterized protein n=1 Tax=Euplotes crassus TaxID=5936 RepID=A0AAD1XTQ1_EUPCR|nr:unnamed protein product [Moneuplotes crassus]